MKSCPKCGHKRHIWNLSQYCPECKTNLMFYGFEERFYADAKLAEMSLANVRMKLAKVKTGLIGGKLQIARFAVVLLPILALLISFGSLTVSLPVYSKTIDISLIGLISVFTDGTFSLLGSITNAAVIGPTVSQFQLALYGFIGCAAFAVLILLLTILCFVSFKKMSVVLCTLSVLGMASSIFTAVSVKRILPIEELVNVTNGFGVFIVCVAFIVVFALNFIIAKNGLPIEYKPGDVERVEMRKLYRKNKTTLDDIPYPIFQTEEERAERQAAIEKTAAELAEAVERGDM